MGKSADEFDVVVAGGGIAGLTAGLVSARAGRRTLVLSGDILGGLLLSIEAIEGFPGFPDGVPGYELCPMTQEQAVAAGAEVVMGEIEALEPRDGGWRVATRDGEYGARAVVLATGAMPRALGVPGERRLWGRGVSHCASCDAPLLRDNIAAVVGGGDSALQEALTLAVHASRVIILQRGETLLGQATFRDRVAADARIEIRTDAVVEEILGDDRVMGVRVRDTRTDAASDLDAAGVFVYVGLDPVTAYLDGRLRLDRGGRIPTDAAMRTALPGVFAAGIVRAGAAGRAAASAGDGATAAAAADQYLTDGAWPEPSDEPQAGHEPAQEV